MKTCTKCGVPKRNAEFHNRSKDSLLRRNECKDCARIIHREQSFNRHQNGAYLARERERCRIKQAKRRKMGLANANLISSRLARNNWAIRNPVKKFAHNAANNARLCKPLSCESCGKHSALLHKHHKDYSKPLEVTWLCPPCHGIQHRKPIP